MQLAPATLAELDRRLAAHATQLKQRIAQSNSTHDWQGDAAQQLADRIVGDLAPLVAADLGHLQVQGILPCPEPAQPRLQRRMQALRPQVQALGPSIQRLADLQQGVRGADGQPLNLVRVGP